MVHGPFGFPAEDLLTDVPPNYPMERMMLTAKLVMTLLFFIVLPILLARPVVKIPSDFHADPSATQSTVKDRNSKQKKNKKTLEPSIPEEKILEIHPLANLLAATGAILTMTYLVVMTSPDNYYTINAVFQAPLFTRNECQYLLQMADNVAAANFAVATKVQSENALSGKGANETMQQLLTDPKGWNKLRHQEYPTTDLNLVTDPFTKENREWLQQKLDARLAPILQRIWGIPPGAIRANDMFVVRYDENRQTRLVNHTDTAFISINILLDDEFQGGGTRFWNRATQAPFAHIEPTQVGQVLLHSALLNHEGMHVEKGRRTILVGFLEVDRVNPFVQGAPLTGLSWYASWGSLFWLINKLKQGYLAAYFRLSMEQSHWRNNRYIRSFMGTAKKFLNDFTDSVFEHKVHYLVADENRDDFLRVLDDAHVGETRATWFEGQHVDVDITGHVFKESSSRTTNTHRFHEL